MNKYVIYTILTGGYDDILQPLVVDDRFDYVLFSNDYNEKQIGVWKIRPIPLVVNQKDDKRLSRYPKTHPESLLSEYESSLYIDANIQIADQWVYDRFVELSMAKVEIAGVRLPVSDCIYSHAYDMCLTGVEHDYQAMKQCHILYKLGFPEHYGLNENNIIFRRHTKRVRDVDEDWWWWVTNFSYRDQFSFMYVIWKHEMEMHYFLPIGEWGPNTKHFTWRLHDKLKTPKRIVKKNPFEYIRFRCRKLDKERYRNHWSWLYKQPYPRIAQFFWGIGVAVFNTFKLIKKFFQVLKRDYFTK